MPPFIPVGLYAIVDDSSSDPLRLATDILDGGCRLLQLRAKKLSSGEFLRLSREISRLCNDCGALFIVNDRVDVALLSHAHGVHLGQDDLPLDEARQLLGEGKVIGISTHNIEEAIEAQTGGANYIGFGPLFGTKTKKDAQEEKGLQSLKELRSSVSIPIVAIGGINGENMISAFQAGADAVAVISVIADAGDAKRATEDLIKKIEQRHEG